MEEFSYIPEKKICPREAVKRQSTSTFPCIPLMPERLATEKKKGGGRGMSFPGGSVVKNPPANARDTGPGPWVGKMPWGRKRQPTPNILAWRIPWTEEPGRLQSMMLQSQTGRATKHQKQQGDGGEECVCTWLSPPISEQVPSTGRSCE